MLFPETSQVRDCHKLSQHWMEQKNAYFWGFLGVRLIGGWLHFRKRSIGLRVLQHPVFIQVPSPHPVEGSSAECWSYRCTHGSSKLIPPWINWLITTFEFLNSLFLWAPPFQVSLLVSALWIARRGKFGNSWAPWTECCGTPGRYEALPWEKEDLKGLCTHAQKVSSQVEKHKGEWKGGLICHWFASVHARSLC